MRSIVVLLPLQPASAQAEFAYALSQDGRSVDAHASAPAALLPMPTGAGGEVIAIAPAAALSWHQVELPKGTSASSPRLRAVLQGLLEERLLDDADGLHFALQPQARAGAPVWVAVCDRAWLRSAVQVLEAAGRPAARIVPEFTPEGDTTLYALGDADQASLAVTGSDGVMLLPLAPGALALLPSLPEGTACIAEPAVAGLAEELLQQKVVLQQAPERWLQAARSSWDLAQSDFASSGRARTAKKLAAGWADFLRAPQWRPVRWGAVLLAVLHLAGLNAWAWKERSALADKRVAVDRTLTTTFPQVRTIVAPVVQMEKEVALLRQASGASSGRDLEAMLAALAAAAPQQAVTGLDFNGTELRVRGPVASPAQAGAITASLKGLGYSAALQGELLVIAQEAAP